MSRPDAPPGEAGAPAFKPIIIRTEDGKPDGAFIVEQDGRNSGALAFDEMVGQVISLTYHHRDHGARYHMLTPEEWDERRRRLEQIVAERHAQEPAITLSFSKEAAQRLQAGLSDLLCWCRGFTAASSVMSFGDSPLGVEECRDLNIALKRAIDSAEKEQS